MDLPEPRPLADRICGLDAVVCDRGPAAGLRDTELDVVRVAVAVFNRRHGELCDYLDRGGQPVLAPAEGIVAYWPDDADHEHPLNGTELLPIAAAVLTEVGDLEVLVPAAARLAEHLRTLPDTAVDLAELVVIESCETLCFAAALDLG